MSKRQVKTALAGARFEQELAQLFYRSGWTQEQLAKKEGKSQTHVAKFCGSGGFWTLVPVELLPKTPPSRA